MTPPSGYKAADLIQQGQWGLPIILKQFQYITCCPPSRRPVRRHHRALRPHPVRPQPRSISFFRFALRKPIYYLSQIIDYPEDASSSSSSSSSSSQSGPASGTANGNTRQIVTSFAYTFWPGRAPSSRRTTTWPVLPASQNGSGVAARRQATSINTAILIWRMDERGFIIGFHV